MKFENIRHGHKEGEGLSAKGIEQAREKAGMMLEEIDEAPEGTVTYIMTSNVGRAVATRDAIEASLKDRTQGREDIEFVSVQDIEGIKRIKDEPTKKVVVTELQPTTALGFNERTPSLKAFLKYKKEYKNDEDLIGMTWIAKPEEIDRLKEKAKERLPDYDVDSIKPSEFIETPEEAAAKYIRLMKRMTEITEKHFPGRPWKSLHVGHNMSADFAAAALMKKDLSLKTIEELGGKFRNFMESATFEVKDGKLITRYRDEEVENEVSLDDVIQDLEKKSEERKKQWGQAE